jgi:acetyl-CoA acyltransferase
VIIDVVIACGVESMVGTLENTNGRYGLQTMCEWAGMANATGIERL